jgi:hypothetical protein
MIDHQETFCFLYKNTKKKNTRFYIYIQTEPPSKHERDWFVNHDRPSIYTNRTERSKEYIDSLYDLEK